MYYLLTDLTKGWISNAVFDIKTMEYMNPVNQGNATLTTLYCQPRKQAFLKEYINTQGIFTNQPFYTLGKKSEKILSFSPNFWKKCQFYLGFFPGA